MPGPRKRAQRVLRAGAGMRTGSGLSFAPMDAKPSWRAARSAALLSGLALALTACAGLSMERDTATSGTFRSSALTFTVLSIDMPGEAIAIAQGNVADSGSPTW